MFENDEELINEFHIKSGHSLGSIKSYRTVFNKYRNFHAMSLCDLLAEAITEQENRTPENRLSIYDRIISFRNFLVENHTGNTINNSISKIKTFYRYNRVYLPFIPPLNTKNIRKNEIISFEDLPSKDELRRALNVADDNLALWILVIVSSGTTRAEAKSMTNEMFFRGTQAYRRKESFRNAMKCLASRNDAVCTCNLIRAKTDKPYYTFLNPECVAKIAEVKLKQRDLDLKSPLLKYDMSYVNCRFKALNDSWGFGKAGGYARLRPHMLRKFHSTHLNQGSIAYRQLSMDDVDCLQGRGKNRTREAYFKDNPIFLKFEYIKSMNNVAFYHEYDWKIEDREIKIFAKDLGGF